MFLYKFLTLFTTLLFCSKSAAGGETVRIKSADDFSSFVSNVSLNINYEGTTVLIDTDLSLSEKTLDPIGNSSRYFSGTFDGQGHIISDLKMNSSIQYAGLFGYSSGLTVKNVVLDSSCSILSTYITSFLPPCVGGIIGYSGGNGIIENTINMADVTFGRVSISCDLYIGGITGSLSSGYVKNCANYGAVTQSGYNTGYSYIGGIAGYLDGRSRSYYIYIQNCLNHGEITHNGRTSYGLYIGGITGRVSSTYIENCVSAGGIATPTTTPYGDSTGTIVGYASSDTSINYCYYTSELNRYKSYTSYATSYNITTFELNEIVSVGGEPQNTLVNALNAYSDYYVLRGCSKWLLNKDSKSMKFTIDGRINPITMDYKIILLPTLASEGTLMFDGWYTDSNCKNLLQSFEITEDKELYGKFEENTNNYTITFDTKKEGVSIAPITTQLGTVVSLPSDLTRGYCNISFWENEYGDRVGLSLAMPAHDFTLYAVWECTHITTPDDLIDFSKIVKEGDTYYGTTVYLDADLSFSDKTLEPIGKGNKYFRGTFDGQGHTISDIKMNSSLQYTGLFGYSYGLTIKNVVLDSSCSITSSYDDSGYTYLGGIIGYCYASGGKCTIENSVNMADATFSSIYSDYYYLYFGGIAGKLSTSYFNYQCYMENCANYGSVTHSGTSISSYIGGIVGYLDTRSSSIYAHLYNCLNYGAITHNGKTTYDLYIGGIAGYTSYTYLENCVSAGKISTPAIATYSNYTGSIVGQAYNYTYINYCYYTSDVGEYQINGTGAPESTEGTPDSPTTADLSLVGNLNSRVTSDNGWNKWLLNTNNKAVSFKMNANNDFSLSSTLIILPNLASDWRTFVAWFTDSTFTTPFSESSVPADTTLYGRWDIFTVTFDGNGGNVSETSRNVTYNSAYGELPEVNRSGCTFNGWFTDDNEVVTSETVVRIAGDHTLHAQWTDTNFGYVGALYPLVQLVYFLV